MNILASQSKTENETVAADDGLLSRIYDHIEESRWFNGGLAAVDIVIIGLCLYFWQ